MVQRVVVEGHIMTPSKVHNGQWKWFLDSLEATQRGIDRGENYSLMSCILYYRKRKRSIVDIFRKKK